ncbi:hypothetical protein NDU88_004920 [Pleurodeles waltl]|uniref:Uncharacterized protein n=1 Tax=Pleurodeles waltl TaxID=8319 RepID=A0AAV7RMB6_PLEWA|nr:hypothetical protein NDU88_004920 [Pleurodeles waltl]
MAAPPSRKIATCNNVLPSETRNCPGEQKRRWTQSRFSAAVRTTPRAGWGCTMGGQQWASWLRRQTESFAKSAQVLCNLGGRKAVQLPIQFWRRTRSRCILRALHSRRFMSAPRSGDARTRLRPPQLGLARLRAAPCPMRALVGPPAQAPARKGLALPWTRKRNSPLGRGGGEGALGRAPQRQPATMPAPPARVESGPASVTARAGQNRS